MRDLPASRPRHWLGTCAFLALAGTATLASAGQVYQWKDAQGVTHYSDKPPGNEQYKDRRIDNQGGPVQAAEPTGKSVENPQCTTARRNLEVLQGSAPVHQLGEDGKTSGQALDNAQRENQRGLAEAAVKAYCSN
ncbi:DUF4124 domain-containing protein [Pseudoxanthomonas wuyuanensis]|uniref:DUF4124 domain-containing protein n=1 Tax=Pseudoxanthomonas wuyuanensis TaxID=1073196 RepID=A0A286DC57_9GAMM|nr:DUF4124 domain-containing protein [Pseudoxanthomonas wuyuanensis]KAF1716579.1 DUF4124 domain-containing protein [Pseudoxanthomonas wuyuanensis]SOD56199.1 protein of unknown function [Pseudoxanthomonas wuyuanensis]